MSAGGGPGTVPKSDGSSTDLTQMDVARPEAAVPSYKVTACPSFVESAGRLP
jgi:hypothetical protein